MILAWTGAREVAPNAVRRRGSIAGSGEVVAWGWQNGKAKETKHQIVQLLFV
jgi:hypothetical protein